MDSPCIKQTVCKVFKIFLNEWSKRKIFTFHLSYISYLPLNAQSWCLQKSSVLAVSVTPPPTPTTASLSCTIVPCLRLAKLFYCPKLVCARLLKQLSQIDFLTHTVSTLWETSQMQLHQKKRNYASNDAYAHSPIIHHFKHLDWSFPIYNNDNNNNNNKNNRHLTKFTCRATMGYREPYVG